MIRKVYAVSIIVIGVLIAATIVANAVGINIVDIARQRIGLFAAADSQTAAQELDAEKARTENDILNYIDQYKSDVRSILEQYSKDETQKAKDEVHSKYTDVVNTLDSAKQSVIDDGKAKIKLEIDGKKEQIKADLDSELSVKIQDRFNQ